MPATLNDYYFVFVDKTYKSDNLILGYGDGSNSKQQKKTAQYKNAVDPTSNVNYVFSIEKNTANSNPDNAYSIRPVADSHLLLQTDWDAAWYVRQNDQPATTVIWTQFLFAYNTDWTIQNNKIEEHKGDNNYWGAWATADVKDGEEIAGNKSGADVGHYDIYSIKRSEYWRQYMLKNGTVNVDITKALINADFEIYGNSSSWGLGWNGVGNNKTTSFARQTSKQDNFNGAFAEMYGNLSETDLYQTIKLNKGKYSLSAYCIGGDGQATLYVKVGEKTSSVLVSNGKPSVLKTIDFYVADDDTEVRIGYSVQASSSTKWVAIDNITLKGSISDEYIVNNDFEGCENGNFPGWNILAPNGGNTWKNGDHNVEYWIGTVASGKFDYYQNVTGLTPGKYKVSARMWNTQTEGAAFAATSGVYANNGAVTVWGLVDSDCDNAHMIEKESELITVTNGNLRVGVANKETMVARWFGVDWIKLTLVEEIKIDDVRSNITDLLAEANSIKDTKQTSSVAGDVNTAIANAEGYMSNDNLDNLITIANNLTSAVVASQASIAAYAALKTELDKDYFCDRSAAFTTIFTYRTDAQTMYDEATAATADVNTKAAGMLNAYRDYVKGIAANYPTVEGVKEARDADAWVFTTDPTNKGNLNNPVNNDIAANAMRENWKGSGLAGDMKQTVSVPNGKYFLRMVSFTRNSPNANDYIYIKSGETTETSVTFGDPGKPNGFVNITNPIEVTNGEVEIGLHIGSGADWAAIGGVVLYAYDVDDYDRATATNKYGTICLPYAATATGATVYSAEINDEGTSVVLTEVGTDLVAGTPYIYQATADDQTFAYASGNVVAAPVAAAPLVGVFTATQAPTDSYVMQTQAGVQKFYKATAGNEPTVGAYKAYISVPAASAKGSLSIGFGDDNTTAVSAVNALIEGKAEIYTIGGVKLEKLQKGINIVNGVPVMVK